MFYYGQRKIKINRQAVSASKQTGRIYLIAYQDNIMSAMKDLSSSAFKVYLVLMMNKDQFQIDFSPQYFSSIASVCKDTARNNLKQLCQKGYLIQIDETHYNFYQYPHFSFSYKKVKEEKRLIIDHTTGEVFIYTYNELRKFVNEQMAKKIWQEAEIYEER